MKEAALIFPHQLFEDNPVLKPGKVVYLTEEFLFFQQYRFHKQKITFHRASMQFYRTHLKERKFEVKYINAHSELSDVRALLPHLAKSGISVLHCIDPVDDWLEKRIKSSAQKYGLKIIEYDSPLFLNTRDDVTRYVENQKNLRQTAFYIEQRKKRKILLDAEGRPAGGKWSYDSENRLKYPKDKVPPAVTFPKSQFHADAENYVSDFFPDNPGALDPSWAYPVTFDSSKEWLHQFVKYRLAEFGPYEDAIVKSQHLLNHSLLSPLLNVGLITPHDVLDAVLKPEILETIPLNSIEGFIRQVMGWREFIRGIYVNKGIAQRTTNHWSFTTKMPASFYDGQTGIEPFDSVVHKVLKTGYCHHIERLMILGNFMLLCEVNPDAVYQWFMELFIDAYDWVMVPNVYGMSQFADGGLMATKPYISGSNYILKMSDFKRGAWQKIWDGLFWRFMHEHRDFFKKNPRMSMLIRNFDRMELKKKQSHLQNAQEFLHKILE